MSVISYLSRMLHKTSLDELERNISKTEEEIEEIENELEKIEAAIKNNNQGIRAIDAKILEKENGMQILKNSPIAALFEDNVTFESLLAKYRVYLSEESQRKLESHERLSEEDKIILAKELLKSEKLQRQDVNKMKTHLLATKLYQREIGDEGIKVDASHERDLEMAFEYVMTLQFELMQVLKKYLVDHEKIKKVSVDEYLSSLSHDELDKKMKKILKNTSLSEILKKYKISLISFGQEADLMRFCHMEFDEFRLPYILKKYNHNISTENIQDLNYRLQTIKDVLESLSDNLPEEDKKYLEKLKRKYEQVNATLATIVDPNSQDYSDLLSFDNEAKMYLLRIANTRNMDKKILKQELSFQGEELLRRLYSYQELPTDSVELLTNVLNSYDKYFKTANSTRSAEDRPFFPISLEDFSKDVEYTSLTENEKIVLGIKFINLLPTNNRKYQEDRQFLGKWFNSSNNTDAILAKYVKKYVPKDISRMTSEEKLKMMKEISSTEEQESIKQIISSKESVLRRLLRRPYDSWASYCDNNKAKLLKYLEDESQNGIYDFNIETPLESKKEKQEAIKLAKIKALTEREKKKLASKLLWLDYDALKDEERKTLAFLHIWSLQENDQKPRYKDLIKNEKDLNEVIAQKNRLIELLERYTSYSKEEIEGFDQIKLRQLALTIQKRITAVDGILQRQDPSRFTKEESNKLRKLISSSSKTNENDNDSILTMRYYLLDKDVEEKLASILSERGNCTIEDIRGLSKNEQVKIIRNILGKDKIKRKLKEAIAECEATNDGKDTDVLFSLKEEGLKDLLQYFLVEGDTKYLSDDERRQLARFQHFISGNNLRSPFSKEFLKKQGVDVETSDNEAIKEKIEEILQQEPNMQLDERSTLSRYASMDKASIEKYKQSMADIGNQLENFKSKKARFESKSQNLAKRKKEIQQDLTYKRGRLINHYYNHIVSERVSGKKELKYAANFLEEVQNHIKQVDSRIADNKKESDYSVSEEIALKVEKAKISRESHRLDKNQPVNATNIEDALSIVDSMLKVPELGVVRAIRSSAELTATAAAISCSIWHRLCQKVNHETPYNGMPIKKMSKDFAEIIRNKMKELEGTIRSR